MTDLFNKKDVLTGITADQAIVGTKGYFGSSLRTIAYNVERNDVHRLCAVNEDETSCFTDEEGLDYLFFLPEDKVKEKVKEPVYRPFYNLDELFNFFYTEFIKDNFCDQTEKALFFLGKTLVLKDKYHDYIKVMTIKEVDFINNCSGDGGSDNIELNCFTLLYLFNNFEIKKDGKFVPFGVKEWTK